jgi:hypothetical protein
MSTVSPAAQASTKTNRDYVWLRAAQEIDLEFVKSILDEWSTAHGMGRVAVPENLAWKKNS